MMKNKYTKTLYSIFFFSLMSFSFFSCAQPTLEEKRKLTMIRVIDLIKIKDSSALSTLIDTSYTYRVLGRERFFSSINNIHSKFASNQILNRVSSSDINILEGPIGNSYEILLYTSENKGEFYHIIMRFIGNEYDKVYSFQARYNDNSGVLDALPKSHLR